MSNEFPAQVKQFITDRIDSVAELELLLLMRSNSEKSWTPQEACARLYASADAISLLLRGLKNKRMLATTLNDQAFVYQPDSPEMARLIDELAELYRDRRVAVITAVYSKPTDKIQSFADSFRLRKDK
jgi:hypothetical protein